MLQNYVPVLLFIAVGILLGVMPILLGRLLGPLHPDKEKNAPYECGFDAFLNARSKFDIRFYLVSILFIIFDLEVSFLFPWALSLSYINFFGFWTMFIFLIVLTIGFVYEWKQGALEWE